MSDYLPLPTLADLANTTAPNATAPEPQSNGKGLSDGAIVGIVLGCIAFVALMVAAIAATYGRNKRYRSRPHELGQITGYTSGTSPKIHERIYPGRDRSGGSDNKRYRSRPHELGQSTGYTPDTSPKIREPPPGHDHSGTSDLQLERFLLEGAPDNHIAMEFKALDDLITQHVDTHYALQPMSVRKSALISSLTDLGFAHKTASSVEATAGTVAVCCMEPKTRHVGLRHVIATVAFRSIDINSHSRLSMLPSPVAAFLQSIPMIGDRDNALNPMPLALSKWRKLSALLLNLTPEERTPLQASETDVAPQAQALTQALNTFLQHFVPRDEQSRHEQADHLQAVIFECAKLGYEVFSHPCDWEFVYEQEGVSRGASLLVFPGLNKASHRNGKPYRPPQQVVEPYMAAI